MEALRLWTVGSAWFSGEDGKKGVMAPGQLADLAVLSRDYFSVPDDEIKSLESALTIVGGKVVHASHEFSALAPPPLPVSPNWAPVTASAARRAGVQSPGSVRRTAEATHTPGPALFTCGCFAF